MIRRFLADRRGNFGIIAAAAAVPIFGAGAFAVDYINAASYKAGVQDAIDAAVLAAAASSETTEQGMRKVAEDVLIGNLPGDTAKSVTIKSFAYNKTDGTVTLEASGQIPSLFARLFDIPVLNVANISQAVRPSGKAIEIALVLDNTFSMTAAAGGSNFSTPNPGGTLTAASSKLDHLKSAASSMVDLFENQPKDLDVKISVVPFARYVNVGLGNRNASWISVPQDSSETKNVCWMSKPVLSKSGCVTKNGTSNNDGVISNYTYEQCSNIVYGPEEEVCQNKTYTTTWNGCVGSRNHPWDMRDEKYNFRVPGLMNVSCGTPVLPLTDNFDSIRSTIGGMVAQGDTYIPAGVMWGWRTLSTQAPYAESKKTSDDARKFLVIMTDGENTRSPNYPEHNNSDGAEADKLMVEACNNAKKDGIEIFTVGVGVTGASTKAGLAKCASTPDAAILVENASELEKVFSDIAKEILMIRLSM